MPEDTSGFRQVACLLYNRYFRWYHSISRALTSEASRVGSIRSSDSIHEVKRTSLVYNHAL